MRAIRCEGCQRPQPKDWTAGQRCVHCGGAVRADVRCAACTRWTPSARFCRHCAAELVPEAWYGVGRMLVQAGVDGLSLAARVAALDEGQRETFSSRFARQRANVERAVSLARCCEAGFLTTGHADALEDELVASLPLDEASAQALSSLPPGPHSRGDGVAAAFAQTVVPRLRVLAAIARLRDGEARDPVASLVVGALDASGALGVEAAVALGLAAVASGRDVVPPWQRDAFEQAVARARVELPDSVEVALVFAEGLAHQTPASALADALEAAGVTTLLQDALARPRSEVVHFGAARRLDDARALDAFVTHPRYGDAALRALRSVAPGRIVARLVRSTEDDQRRRLLTSVPHPLDDEAARALAGLLPHCGQRLRDDVLRRLCERPFDELPPDALAPLEAFLAGQTLPPERALDLVEWAVTPRERGQPWRQAAAVRPFADHAARALAPLPPTRETLDRSGVTAFLSVAQQGPAFDVLLGWLRVPEAAERALRALAWLQGMLDAQSPSPDDRGLALTVSAWAALDASGRR
ncbi:MAG: zinc ribbon domain-containing protein, partial [Myxococcaceae bacterium]|nr:zinc ribbon domain-containing protein [Myxococcaceae bacterium]